MFFYSFTGDIKLKGLIIVGGPDDSHPSEVKLQISLFIFVPYYEKKKKTNHEGNNYEIFCFSFKNREGMTFDEAGSEADQKFELVMDRYGVHEYPTK